MRLGIYGGTFNPPHIGHIKAATTAVKQLELDVLLIVPAGIPPHKALPTGSPTNDNRMEMARLSFLGLPCAEIIDLELKKEGISYTIDTLNALRRTYPGAEVFLMMGSDMYLSFEKWKDFQRLLVAATPAVFSRADGENSEINVHAAHLSARYNAKTTIIINDVTDISSTTLRQVLSRRGGFEFFDEKTYGYIIKNRLYGARADYSWLRARTFEIMKPKRIPHILGCEGEAVKLATRWGAEEDEAREAAILHDITKHLELDDQLQLCKEYDIMTDNVETVEAKLLHAKTGAAVAFDLYGVSQAVHDAIEWHTTGRANMSLLEKIIYLADYIEPTRDFDGLGALRSLAYTDLDQAVMLGLRMSIEDMRARGITPHLRTAEALAWFNTHSPQSKGD